MLKLAVNKLNELFSLINTDRELYLPLEKDGSLQFGSWSPGAAERLDKLLTVKSPKEFFFPHIEDIAAFKVVKKEITIKDERIPIIPFAVFGVRACDTRSLELLDRVFLNAPTDTFYEERRRNSIIISSACFEPEETCFCTTFNIDALNPGGDIATWLIGNTLYWKALSDKGKELTEKLKSLFEQTSKQDEEIIQKQQAKAKEILFSNPFKDLSLEVFNPDRLMDIFNSSIWEDMYTACLSCGTCTFICPTCHCYDIQDFNKGNEIQRFKCWDSCMYSDFTLMAHGNPRTSQLERFRQRYMHKLVYFPDKNEGLYACVGCGRCIQKCPVSMNIVKVTKALGSMSNV